MNTEDPMQCFARWYEDPVTGDGFRDQTLLQFGEDWRLLASVVLLNPGSAVPAEPEPQDAYLEALNLPFLVTGGAAHYYRFTVDPFMRKLSRVFTKTYRGGVVKLYDLFNLRESDTGRAIAQLERYASHPRMFTPPAEIQFGEAPVVIACGANAYAWPELARELKMYVSLARPEQLHAIGQAGPKRFRIDRAVPDAGGLVESYHPSYTCKYGNVTELGPSWPAAWPPDLANPSR